MQRLNVAPLHIFPKSGTDMLTHSHTSSEAIRTSSFFFYTSTGAFGYSCLLARSETLTRHVLPSTYSFLVPAPQHRLHALISSLRQPSRAAVPLRLPRFLDSLCVLDAGFLASDSLCPPTRRFTTPTDHLHCLLSRLGLAPRLNSLHAQSHFPIVRTTAVLPSASACPRQAASLRNSQHISHALSWLGLALTRSSLVSPLQPAWLPPLDFPLDST
jgi:hypothetical protein